MTSGSTLFLSTICRNGSGATEPGLHSGRPERDPRSHEDATSDERDQDGLLEESRLLCAETHDESEGQCSKRKGENHPDDPHQQHHMSRLLIRSSVGKVRPTMKDHVSFIVGLITGP